MTSSSTIIGTKTGRARRTFGQLWQIPMFFIGLAALLGVAASGPWRLTPQEAEFRRYLISLRRDLANDAGENDALAGQADNVLLRVSEFPHRAGEAHFLAGSAFSRQAQDQSGRRAAELWARAAVNLEKANTFGVAEADLPALQYRLGYALYRQKKDMTRAIDLMTLAVEKGAAHPVEGYLVLVEAHLHKPQPDLDAALAANRRMIELIPDSQIEAQAQARLQHAELLLRKQRRPDAIRELEQIGSNAPAALRVQARLLQARMCEAEGAWSDAVPIWSALLKDASTVPGGRAFIYYRLGWCYHEMKPANYAENIRVWTEALKLGDSAGQAAGIHLGELRLALGGEQAALALADWTLALKNVHSPEEFKNPLVDIAQVRTLFDQAGRFFEQERDVEKTQAIAELFQKITPGGVAELRIAQAAEAHARLLAEKFKAKIAGVTEAHVLAQFRRAGQAYESASLIGKAPDRAETLWRGIQCYLAAHDGPQAQKVLMQFVQIETNEERLAEAWFTIGDLYQSGGEKENAYKAFTKCIQYPNTMFAARSDYHIAEVEIEKKNLVLAEEILTKIITGASNQIDADTREKSHFRLASLLLSVNELAKARIYLKACVTLYPGNPRHLLVREQLGECCRQLAKIESKRLVDLRGKQPIGTANDPQQVRDQMSNHRQKRNEYLKEAEQNYFFLANALETQKLQRPLTALEQVLWQRAWLGMGECHFENEMYPRALANFQHVQLKGRRSLESLYASWRVVVTVEHMLPTAAQPGQLKGQALEAVKMLMDDLGALPAEHEVFHLPGVLSRSEWLQWATDTQKRLAAPTAKETPLPAIR